MKFKAHGFACTVQENTSKLTDASRPRTPAQPKRQDDRDDVSRGDDRNGKEGDERRSREMTRAQRRHKTMEMTREKTTEMTETRKKSREMPRPPTYAHMNIRAVKL